jgi:type I restriction enzyme S subunit
MKIELPSTWNFTSLADISSLKKKTIDPQKIPVEKFEYYSIPSYLNGGLPIIEESKKINSSKLILEPDTLLFGKLNPRVEKVWRVRNYTRYRKIGSTEWLPIKLHKSVSVDFVYFALWSNFIMPLAKQHVSGSTPSRQRVDPKTFYNFKIPLPPLEEQKKIAAVLSLVQEAISQQEKAIALTTELKKALMQKLFTEGTHNEPQKMTAIGLIPESWGVVPLEKTGDVIYGIQASVANNLKPIGTKILTNKNITLDGEIDLSKINYFEIKSKRHYETILRKGDILFNWRSGSKEHVGKTALFDLDGEFIHSSFILRIRPHAHTNNKYLFYYLTHLRESGYFIKLQTYSINAKFNKSAVSELPTALPSTQEQVEIALIIEKTINKINIHQDKLLYLKELFQTLLHQLMTAQIRVDDLDLSALNLEP